jgi:TldD protein
MCKKQKKEYGYLFEEVIGGFTNADRMSINAFNIIPIVVYRVYTDGRPDEMVRGVSLIGTPLTMFSEIEACGGKQAVFNGYCGAESGSVPTSTIAPSLLVNKIETQQQFEIKGEVPQISSPDLAK